MPKKREEILKEFDDFFSDSRVDYYESLLIKDFKKFLLSIIEEQPKKEFCEWTEDDIDGGWDTQCDNKHLFIDGTPTQNDYKFCPYCSKIIKEVS
jgi:hypothetical protein